MNKPERKDPDNEISPILMAVLANRMEAIVREMTNTLLKTARSAVLAVVREEGESNLTSYPIHTAAPFFLAWMGRN